MHQFDGHKYFYFSETNALGGRNPFLGVFLLIAGFVCLLIGALFFVKMTRESEDEFYTKYVFS